MPHFIVHCLDAADALPRRLQYYDAHKAYLEAAPISVLISGPLTLDDGITMIGSFFLVEAPERSAVEAFNLADPFYKAGIWASVSIHCFRKRVDRRT